jgi:hypothetical protein
MVVSAMRENTPPKLVLTFLGLPPCGTACAMEYKSSAAVAAASLEATAGLARVMASTTHSKKARREPPA